ncbi:hypothetical protein C2S52_023155 [Perilla frutescens var. hirtella]|nr:hypothetical protein C2S52_023155 [Perilla frutescens var. hirtella]
MKIWYHELNLVLKRWDVRGFMLLSLSLQAFLLFLTPFRKRSSNYKLIQALFCVYLLADWAANYAAGVIWSTDTNTTNGQPVAFWATFLLVHLGGPDSMTAFSLQDNDFWHRHLLTLIFQCASAAYIFYKTFSQNQIKIPTLFMFVSGFIKYYERTRALYCSSLSNLRDSMRKAPDPGLSYSKLMDAYHSRKQGNLPARIDMIDVDSREVRVKRGRLSHGEAALYAYYWFNIFNRLIVDLKCSYRDIIKSREFFRKRTPEDAFEIVAMELNFMYDILFTKAAVVYNLSGFLLRLLSFALAVASFGVFLYQEKHGDHKKPEFKIGSSDVGITYTLLGGAIALDVIAFIQFLASNWLAAFLKKLPPVELDDKAEEGSTAEPEPEPQLRRRRWSEAVPAFNLIKYCLSPRGTKRQNFLDKFGLSSYFDEIKYVKKEPFTEKLRNHIFEEVKIKSELAGDKLHIARDASAARGDWAIRMGMAWKLLPYVQDIDYDESLLTWHIATELCWCRKEEEKEKEKEKEDIQNYQQHRDLAKLLSNYMMYLVNMKPSIMFGVTDIGQTRLRDTVAEIRREESEHYKKQKLGASINALLYHLLFIIRAILPSCFITFLRRKLRKRNNFCLYLTRDEEEEERTRRVDFCKNILAVNAEVKPVCIKGYKSKSVLFDGCRLAKELNELGDDKWEIMSKVWVEMLSYAAVRCKPQTLAEQLSRGGELISFVWLLMAHFGLVHDHCFEVFDGHRRAKLIVDK